MTGTEIELHLAPNIFEQIGEEASRKGLTDEELCRVIIGEHFAHYSLPSSKLFITPPHSLIQDSTDKIIKMVNMIMKQNIASGIMKCPNCTLTITEAALEDGICSCGYKLG